MIRVAVPRATLAACAGLVVTLLLLALVSATPVAEAGDDPMSPAIGAPQQTPGGTLCFARDGVFACVQRIGLQARGTLTDQVRSLVLALIDGPTVAEQAVGVRSALPNGAALLGVSASGGVAIVRLDLPLSYLEAFDHGDAEDVIEQVDRTLTPFNFARVSVEARDPAQPDAFRPLSSFLPPVSIPQKPGELDSRPSPLVIPASSLTSGQPPEYGQPQVLGGLRGKTVFVSAGHGWYWNSSQTQYRTQRPHYPSAPYPVGDGIVEDFNNAEIVNQYLLQYLWNAGADAWTVRERSLITEMHIVDDLSPAFSVQGGWSSGSGGYSGTYYSATSVIATATATATWAFTPTRDAEYAVYVQFPNISNRTPAARFAVDHAGGSTVVTITQERDGINWRYIGTYPFRGGIAYRVQLSNQSTVAGKTILADAIRIGGGIGDTTVGTAPTPSGKPRWEEQARQYAKWVGLPDADDLNDVIIRPIYAEWEYESGEDAVYVSYHTNGFSGYNTSARGLETYIHDFEPTPDSDLLQDYVHAELVNDIQLGWEAAWPDRGQKSKDLGELRLLDTMPGVLIENGFHDNPQDVEAEKDPRFNLLSARAIYQGLVRYWNSRDPINVPLVFLPEPPTRLRVRNGGPGQVRVEWWPGPTDGVGLMGDLATSYRVYTSTDGFGWGDAISTSATSLTLGGLASGQLIFVRVTGVNAGGESFPTPVLAARLTSNDIAPVLVVYGFDRIDRLGAIKQYDGAEGFNRRMFIDRINRHDYIIQHAEGITLPFDSALHAAVSDGDVGPGNYTIVDWIAGEEQTPDTVLNSSDQALLAAFLDGGGALLISGAEIGFDLVTNGQGAAFYSDQLHAQYVADDAGTYSLSAVAGELFAGLGPFSFDDGTHGTYDVDWPDVIAPRSGATATLLYNGGGAAALAYSGDPCTRLIYLGFPVETIYPAAARTAVMSRAMSFLGACLTSPPDTAILSPSDGAAYNSNPSFNGAAASAGSVSAVQVAIISGTQYYNGSSFGPQESWLTATGTLTWSYALPSLADGDYRLKARALETIAISDTSPAVVTFTLDTVAPGQPSLITPTGGITVASSSPAFAWTGGGDPSGFEFELDGAVEVLDSPALSVTRSVGEGPHTWRVRAFDRAGNYSLWSDAAAFIAPAVRVYMPILMNSLQTGAPPPTCFEAILNGGFENDLANWVSLAQAPPPAIVSSPVFSGGKSVRVGSGVTTTGVITQLSYSSVEQNVTIPSDALTATLTFQRYRISGDILGDLQYVVVLDGIAPLDYLVYQTFDDPQWIAAQFDLLDYAGRAINVRFGVKNDGLGGATGMFVDDVAVQVCTP